MGSETDVRFAVENMFPWRAGSRSIDAYLPNWDIRYDDYPHTTLDLSHTAVSRSDALEVAVDLGDRLAHVHLADGTDSVRDEHLVPGRGEQPVAEVLGHLAERGFRGTVIAEVSTRRAADREARVADLAETLAFARRHLGLTSSDAPPQP
jgi:sugar phosphate isomerase/epimerase